MNYTALTGDLEIHVQNLAAQEDAYYLQLLEYYAPDNSFSIIGSTPLWLDNSTTAVLYKAKFPCGLISQGGRYAVRMQLSLDADTDTDLNEVLATEVTDSEHEQSYAEDSRSKVS